MSGFKPKRTPAKRFPLGDLPEAGLRILELAPDGPKRTQDGSYRHPQQYWVYEVSYACCGHTQTELMSHLRIARRIRTNPTPLCPKCALRESMLEKRKMKEARAIPSASTRTVQRVTHRALLDSDPLGAWAPTSGSKDNFEHR